MPCLAMVTGKWALTHCSNATFLQLRFANLGQPIGNTVCRLYRCLSGLPLKEKPV